MTISEMLQQTPSTTIKIGCRWLSAGHPGWVVNERMPGENKTKEVIRTVCEDRAVQELLKGKKIYNKYLK